jgi:hypothetical protein
VAFGKTQRSNERSAISATQTHHITFWLTQGIICKKAENIFTLADKTNANDIEMHSQTHAMCEELANDQRKEELQVFWSYCWHAYQFGFAAAGTNPSNAEDVYITRSGFLSFHRKS